MKPGNDLPVAGLRAYLRSVGLYESACELVRE
jgi:hypothetical protein